jgi:integrase
MYKAHTDIVLDTRRALKNGTYPVKLRLTFQRQRKYFLTSYSLSEEDYALVQSIKPRGKHKEIKIALQAIEQKAIETINKLAVFTFEGFEKKFQPTVTSNDVFSSYESKIQVLRQEGQAGTASTYECAYYSLLTYTSKHTLLARSGVTFQERKKHRENLLKKKKPLPFSSVTVDYLKGFEKWMLGRGKTFTSISMYLRTLRTLYNDAIASGDIDKDLYPFGKRKYQLPAGKNIKKALPLADIQKLFQFTCTSDSEARARDLWVFSYLCNGINLKDIARLKYKQLDKDTITFIRAKTERTSRHDLKSIVAMRTPEINSIIERWGNKPSGADSYVFPILTGGLSPEEELAKVRQATKRINYYMKRIATQIGIEHKVTTYTARHSFSTVLKRAGAPTEFISEALGHSNLKTTEYYLDSFEVDVKKQYAAHLTAFSK